MKIFTMFALTAALLLSTTSIQAGDVINERTGAEYTDLQVAINEANKGDTLKLSGHFDGPFSISQTLTLKGSHNAVLDGNNLVRVLDLSSNGSDTVILDHLTIKNGNAQVGAGIFSICTLILKHVILINNNSTGTPGGGGIANFEVNPLTSVNGVGALTLYECFLSGNKALNNGSGGGILSNGGSLTIDDSKFYNNSTEVSGGGIAIVGGTNIITDTEFVKNSTAGNGGGLSVDDDSTTTLNKVKIVKNTAATGAGIEQSTSTLVINHSKLEKNSASSNGGGLAETDGGIVTFNDSKITKNKAGINGGGIYSVAGSTFVLNNTDIENNTPNDIFD